MPQKTKIKIQNACVKIKIIIESQMEKQSKWQRAYGITNDLFISHICYNAHILNELFLYLIINFTWFEH